MNDKSAVISQQTARTEMARLQQQIDLIDRLQQEGHEVTNGVQLRRQIENVLRCLRRATPN